MREITNLLSVPASGGGVAWSANPTGVNANLVVLDARGQIAEHRNDGVDVLIAVVAGSANLTVDGEGSILGAGDACVVPRGTTRMVTAGPGGARYLTVHAARGPLQIASRE